MPKRIVAGQSQNVALLICVLRVQAEEVPAQQVSPAPSYPASAPLTPPETPSSSAHADQAMSAAATAERHLDTAAMLAVTSATYVPADVASLAPASFASASQGSAAPPQVRSFSFFLRCSVL